MPQPASTRLALIGPNGATDEISTGDDQINAIITQLEGVAAGFIQGTSRPAAAPALEGYFYVHTTTKQVSYCTGSVWIDIPGSAGAGYEIGYDQITSPVTIVSGTESSGTPVITCGAHTFDGAPVMAEFFSPGVLTAVTSTTPLVRISLFEGATQIGRLATIEPVAAGSTVGQLSSLSGRLRFTPSAGSHSYTVTAYALNGDGTVQAGAGGTGVNVPAFVRFTKV